MRVPASRAILVCAVAVASAFSAAAGDDRLTTAARLEIIRQLAHEFATVQIPLPAARKAKEAVEVDATGELNGEKLRRILAKRGVAIESGTVVQLTGLKFKKDHILIEVNGGGKVPGVKWYERIQITGSGAGVPTTTRIPTSKRRAPEGADWTPGSGSYVRLDFGRRIPEVTADEIKELLAEVLEFGIDTATLPWIETIPEEFQEAIREKRPVVGMNTEMVLAALGRPERKVREVRSDQQEYTDWIYGIPPYLIFVTFLGDEVVEVREFK